MSQSFYNHSSCSLFTWHQIIPLPICEKYYKSNHLTDMSNKCDLEYLSNNAQSSELTENYLPLAGEIVAV